MQESEKSEQVKPFGYDEADAEGHQAASQQGEHDDLPHACAGNREQRQRSVSAGS